MKGHSDIDLLEDELTAVFEDGELAGDDGADAALNVLLRAKRILRDAELMKAVKRLWVERRRAVEQEEPSDAN